MMTFHLILKNQQVFKQMYILQNMIHIPAAIIIIGGYTFVVSSLLYINRNNELPRELVQEIHTFIRQFLNDLNNKIVII